MSLLQRLNERAQALKGEQNNEVATKDMRKQRFQNETMPAMQELERFLRELNSQLKVLRPNVRQSFEIAGYGNFDCIPNFDWLFVPGESRLNEYTLEVRWKSRVDTEKATRLTLNSYDRVRGVSETFKRLLLGGIKEEKRGPTGLIVQASVQATGYINSKLNIRAHVEEDVVHFMFENVDQLALVKRQLGAEFIGPDVFDRLGEFILRENDLFVREHWVRGLKAVERKPVPEAIVAPPPVPMVVEKAEEVVKTESVGAAALLESAQDRELDFLAELKFAARYAESAVKKNISMEGENGFSQERDSASLRDAYNRLSTPKIEKLSPFASGVEPNLAAASATAPAAPSAAAAVKSTAAVPAAAVKPTAAVPAAAVMPTAAVPAAAIKPTAAVPAAAVKPVAAVPVAAVQPTTIASPPKPNAQPVLDSLQNPEVSRALGLLARMLGTNKSSDKT
jgi:hypothetical protein